MLDLFGMPAAARHVPIPVYDVTNGPNVLYLRALVESEFTQLCSTVLISNETWLRFSLKEYT
jgi:hypothetical protein